MLEQNKEYEFVNLSANPDHYLLHAQNNTLEVIETTGGSPFPIQMFITFGEEKGLTIPRDDLYPYQSVGIARLADNTIIGGVRHQFKDETKGFSARLAVEFPITTPNYFIKQHQIHLACEWKNWFQWVITQKWQQTK